MTKDEALNLALETLESSRVFVMSREMIKQPEGADWYDNRINAIKEALAQPEQEPVLWMMPDGNTADKWALQFYGGQKGKPLYTTPPPRKWVGLTDEEIMDMYNEPQSDAEMIAFGREVEAKLKEKNA